MWKRGYLGSENMGGAFSALRSSDLIYAGIVDRYFLGKKASLNDLMSWNADGTRMPYRMHSEYLEQLYLHNELARNRFRLGGRVISLTHGELTFALTSGGHNAGVVSGPQHPRRRFRVHTRVVGDKYIDPETWMEQTEVKPGSWWPVWNQWLDKRSAAHLHRWHPLYPYRFSRLGGLRCGCRRQFP